MATTNNTSTFPVQFSKSSRALYAARDIFNEITMGAHALVFLLTGSIKWIEIRKFNFQLQLMPFPSWAIDWVTYGLPTIAGILGLWLFFGSYRRIPIILGTLLFYSMAIFVYLVMNFKLSETIPCSCAGLFDFSWQIHFKANCLLAGAGTLTAITLNKDKGSIIPIFKHLKRGLRK